MIHHSIDRKTNHMNVNHRLQDFEVYEIMDEINDMTNK